LQISGGVHILKSEALMKIISWNVNGIRAAVRNRFLEWVKQTDADIVCVQEIKISTGELPETIVSPEGYKGFWHPAKRPGYSGVAAFVRAEPLRVDKMGIEHFDDEGRVQVLEYPEFTLLNTYFPNSRRDHSRLGYKLEFFDAITEFCNGIRGAGKHVIICGDFNVAHEEIDIARPKQNVKSAGFLPEERAAMTRFLEHGYIDTFRHFNKEGGNYTWWAYFFNAREKNIGWRIDYFCVNREFLPRLKQSAILCEVMGSDHCPILIEIE
jgi:exodeoxyribonuclease-3